MVTSNKKSFVAGFILGAIAGWTTSKIPWIVVGLLLVWSFCFGLGVSSIEW